MPGPIVPLRSRWAAWAAFAGLLVGAVIPFAGFSTLLDHVYGDRPHPVVYALSWVALGLSGMIAAGGMMMYFTHRNRKSIRAAALCLLFMALMYAPMITAIVAMRQTIEAKRAEAASQHASSPVATVPADGPPARMEPPSAARRLGEWCLHP